MFPRLLFYLNTGDGQAVHVLLEEEDLSVHVAADDLHLILVVDGQAVHVILKDDLYLMRVELAKFIFPY